MTKFEIGQTVRLKSGGPPMTISEVFQTRITCLWFWKDTGILHEGVFRDEVLELASELAKRRRQQPHPSYSDTGG